MASGNPGAVQDDAAKRGYLGPLFRAHAGDLIISKIRVGQGSFCIIGGYDQIAVSPEYPVYEPDGSKVLSSYLALCLRTDSFMRRVRGTGNTTKQRIRPSQFEAQRVPLPTLAEQQALVASYSKALNDAAAMEAQALELEAQGLADFETALGLTPPPPLPDRPIFVARFDSLDRWSHEAVLRRITGGDDSTSLHPIVRLGDVIADLENGWSPKCLKRPAQGDEWGVLKVSAATSGQYRVEENKALPASLSPKTKLEVKSGDVLIARASGAANLVGIPAYVTATSPRLMLCDKLFRVVFNQDSGVDAQFLTQILKHKSVRAQIQSEFSNESGMMKNVSKPALLDLTFPLPSNLAEQKKLIADLEAARKSAADLRAKATETRRAGWKAFEAAIFG